LATPISIAMHKHNTQWSRKK